MANTFVKIASVTVGSGGAVSIDFTSIPATYTDLCLKLSIRGTNNDPYFSLLMRLNATTSGYTTTRLAGYGSGVNSDGNTGLSYLYTGQPPSALSTANTFSNTEMYFPNYATSNNKSYSEDQVGENNATLSFQQCIAGLWSNSAAINQITLYNEYGNFTQYSTATLYGIKSS